MIDQVFAACQNGDLAEVQQYIQRGFDVSSSDGQGVTALHWAAINGRDALVDFLLTKGASINAKGGVLKSTPIYWATSMGLINLVVSLLKRGADANIADSLGVNCLFLAAQNKNWRLVLVFASYGMAVDPIDFKGFTPLLWACSHRPNEKELIRALLSLGADVNATTPDKQSTALHCAVSGPKRSQWSTVNTLLHAGVDIHAQDSDGHTAVDLMAVAIAEDNNATRSISQVWRKMRQFEKCVPRMPRKQRSAQGERQGDFNFSHHTKTVELGTPTMGYYQLMAIPWVAIPLLFTFVAWADMRSFVVFLTVAVAVLMLAFGCFGRQVADLCNGSFLGCYDHNKEAAAWDGLLFGLNTASIFWMGLPFFYKLWAFQGYYSVTAFVWLFLFGSTWFFLYKTMTTTSIVPQSRWPLETKLAHIKLLADNGEMGSDNDNGDDDEKEKDNENDSGTAPEKNCAAAASGESTGESGGEARICATTLIRLPLRSKFCREDGHIVSKFDHHCPFVGSTVGSKNHHYFMGFVTSALSAIVLNEALILSYFHARNGDRYWERQSWLEAFVYNVFAFDGFLACCFLLGALLAAWIAMLMLYHLRLIVNGWTTHEKITTHAGGRYGATDDVKRYSEGWFQNGVTFFKLESDWLGLQPRKTDWDTCYTWPSVSASAFASASASKGKDTKAGLKAARPIHP